MSSFLFKYAPFVLDIYTNPKVRRIVRRYWINAFLIVWGVGFAIWFYVEKK